jgi:hypothetical protein
MLIYFVGIDANERFSAIDIIRWCWGWRTVKYEYEESLEEPETKECPSCAEEIKAKAKKCRFCGEAV